MKRNHLFKVLLLFIFCFSITVPLSGCRTQQDKEIVVAKNVKEELNSVKREILELIQEGNILLQAEKFPEAKASYEKAISKDKTNENTYLEIKNNYVKAKRFDDAYYIIKLAIDNNISTDKMGKILEEIKTKFTTIQLENTITQGDDYSLPNPKTIPVDTITNPVNIQWDKKDIDTSHSGIFIFDGYVEEYGRKVQLKLTIKEAVKQTNESTNPSNQDNTKNEKSANNKTITYNSKGLGLAFDMPSSWANNYILEDDGTRITVYMKHENNSNGSAQLFVITSDIHDFYDGKMIDGIYVDSDDNIHKTINGKQYLVGGPTDIGLSENDSKFNLYQTMKKDRSNILKSLRSA